MTPHTFLENKRKMKNNEQGLRERSGSACDVKLANNNGHIIKILKNDINAKFIILYFKAEVTHMLIKFIIIDYYFVTVKGLIMNNNVK